jgi:hypothetical protein
VNWAITQVVSLPRRTLRTEANAINNGNTVAITDLRLLGATFESRQPVPSTPSGSDFTLRKIGLALAFYFSMKQLVRFSALPNKNDVG